MTLHPSLLAEYHTASLSKSNSLPIQVEGFFSARMSSDGRFEERPLALAVLVMLEVLDQRHSRWVLMDCSASAVKGVTRTFPSCTFSPGGRPLDEAVKAVTENLVLLDKGLPLSWSGLAYQMLSAGTEWMPALVPDIPNMLAIKDTLVFTYHAQMKVEDVHAVQLLSLRESFAQTVELSGIIDIQHLIAQGNLCAWSEQAWRGFWANADPYR